MLRCSRLCIAHTLKVISSFSDVQNFILCRKEMNCTARLLDFFLKYLCVVEGKCFLWLLQLITLSPFYIYGSDLRCMAANLIHLLYSHCCIPLLKPSTPFMILILLGIASFFFEYPLAFSILFLTIFLYHLLILP